MSDGFWAGLAKGVFGRVRFGGVVGKICLMFAASTIAAAFVLRVAGGNFWVAVAGLAIVICAFLVVGLVLLFAHLHPDLALLEGAQWLQYQNMIQTKGQPPVLVTTLPVESAPSVPVLEEFETQPQAGQLAIEGHTPQVVIGEPVQQESQR